MHIPSWTMSVDSCLTLPSSTYTGVALTEKASRESPSSESWDANTKNRSQRPGPHAVTQAQVSRYKSGLLPAPQDQGGIAVGRPRPDEPWPWAIFVAVCSFRVRCWVPDRNTEMPRHSVGVLDTSWSPRYVQYMYGQRHPLLAHKQRVRGCRSTA